MMMLVELDFFTIEKFDRLWDIIMSQHKENSHQCQDKKLNLIPTGSQYKFLLLPWYARSIHYFPYFSIRFVMLFYASKNPHFVK